VKTSKILLASLAAAALVSTGGIAAPPTAPIQVSARVVANCSINATNMDFGNYDPLVANKTANALADSTISVSCTKGSPNVSVGLDRGLNATGVQRRLVNAGEFMTYSITDEAGTDWTQTLSGTTVTTGSVAYGPFASVNTAITHVAHGILTAGQDVSVGTYTDTVTATVLF
jgi:spore coat protein U-like protein